MVTDADVGVTPPEVAMEQMSPQVWSEREGALPDIGGCLPIEPSHSCSRTCWPSPEQTALEVTDAEVGMTPQEVALELEPPKVWSDREGALPDIGGCLPIEPSHSRSRTCRPSQEQTVPEVTDADVG